VRHHNPPTLGAFYLGHLGPPSQLTYPDAFQYKRASKEEKRGERGEREEEGKNKIKIKINSTLPGKFSQPTYPAIEFGVTWAFRCPWTFCIRRGGPTPASNW
jgi:hypothetical protein